MLVLLLMNENIYEIINFDNVRYVGGWVTLNSDISVFIRTMD